MQTNLFYLVNLSLNKYVFQYGKFLRRIGGIQWFVLLGAGFE
jgi:hypothetical protein